MSELIKRFEGDDNRDRLLDAILGQKLVHNERDLADALASRGTLQELAAGEILITQGNWDTDLYLILVGEFDVIINGHRQAVRSAGVHVGELSGADPARARTATLVARQESLVLKVPEKVVNEVAANNIGFWKRAMNVVAQRLDERNAKIGKTNDIPRVLLISSSEAKAVVERVVLNLDSAEVAVQTWDKGTFGLSDYPISSLMDAIGACDFTIAVVRADDSLVMRDKESKVARDNVHLEYGISLGLLGRPRSILLVCADEKLHLPSDLAGLTTLRYRDGSPDELERSVRNACIEARRHILKEGVYSG
jgi:CRP/FNR family transcriptional regulator, cyclic AMP receptor protein